jgi:hypothetical protein
MNAPAVHVDTPSLFARLQSVGWAEPSQWLRSVGKETQAAASSLCIGPEVDDDGEKGIKTKGEMSKGKVIKEAEGVRAETR